MRYERSVEGRLLSVRAVTCIARELLWTKSHRLSTISATTLRTLPSKGISSELLLCSAATEMRSPRHHAALLPVLERNRAMSLTKRMGAEFGWHRLAGLRRLRQRRARGGLPEGRLPNINPESALSAWRWRSA